MLKRTTFRGKDHEYPWNPKGPMWEQPGVLRRWKPEKDPEIKAMEKIGDASIRRKRVSCLRPG